MCVVATLFASSARAQTEVPRRTVGVRWDQGVPSVHFSAVDLADDRLRAELDRGLTTVLLMRVYAFTESGAPIAVGVRRCSVIRDMWRAEYRVEFQSAREDRRISLSSLDEVIEQCLIARRMPIGNASHFTPHSGRRVYFGVLLELNPLSVATVQQMRRWLSAPAGGGRVGGRAFYGSMVSLFINRRIGSAERTMRFRSQPVRVR